MAKDTSFEYALEILDEGIVEGYEQVRQSGLTNMFSFDGVMQAAEMLDVGELAYLGHDEYTLLLLNFGKLMKYYGITQESRPFIGSLNGY